MATTRNSLDVNPAWSAGNGLGRLAAWCYDHRRRVLLGWLLAVVTIVGLAQWAGSRLDNNFALHSSPSQQAQSLLARKFGAEYQAYRRAVHAWIPRLRHGGPAQRPPANEGVTWPGSKESRPPKPGCT